MKKIAPLACLCILFSFQKTIAQVNVPVFGSQQLINGYLSSLKGETIPYFSMYRKYAKEALLTRCTDGNKTIEWLTDTVPSTIKGDYVYFTWIAAHSSGSSKGDRNFDLYVNNKLALTFTTHANQYPPYWTFGGKDSVRLVFEYHTQDGAADAHGMVYLRVPLSMCTKEKPVVLKVVGQNQNSSDWYMTFKYSFKEKIDIAPLPFVLKNNTQQQPVRFTVLHFGEPKTLTINSNNIHQQLQVKNGFNVFEIPFNRVDKETNVPVVASIENIYSLNTSIALKPIAYREINLVHHAHTDIGYSHIQEEVIKIHVENIRKALKWIEKTKNYPEESKFKWNIESAWAVENFLKDATEKEKNDFFNAVKNNSIAVSATYANELTGLMIPEEMNWLTEFARNLRDTKQLPIKTGMMSDVPGMSWSMVQALAKNGIKYFSNGPNYMEGLPDDGDRIGHTLKALGDKPFWWKSTTGKDSILMWTCAKGYSSWHGFPQGGVFERGAEKIADYLNELSAKNYPYDMVQWRYNIVSDNGPTDSLIADFVKDWNEKYASPKLVLANVNDVFERFEKKYGKTIPVMSGDLTPYWEDGAYSSAKEETENRLLSEKLVQLQQLAKQLNVSVNKDWLYEVKKNIVLFHEHTWGSYCSIDKPDDPFSVHQWLYKKSFVDSSQFYINKIEAVLLKNENNGSTVTVVNALPWARGGYVEMLSPITSYNVLVDEKGKEIPFQKLGKNKIGFVVDNIAANSRKQYKLSTAANNQSTFNTNFSFAIDSLTGAIKQLNGENKNWVDKNASFKNLLEVVGVNGLNPSNNFLSSFKNLEQIENGPVVKTWRSSAVMNGTNGVDYLITAFNHQNIIRFSVIVDKQLIRDKESLHIAFPFNISNAVVRFGMDSTFITPERGQLYGANKDFFCVQRWLAVGNKNENVTIVSPQAALFEVGHLINEEKTDSGHKKWEDLAQSSSLIFAYIMNNYWHTNYKADQEGKVRFDFYISFSLKQTDTAKANRFGYEMTQPLIGVVSK